MMMEAQENKVALVTGANQGVGFQIAKALTENGYIVYVGSRNLQNGLAAAEKIGKKAQAIQIDVTDKNSVENAAATVQQEFGQLDLLVNNAAISNAGAPGRTLEEIMASNRPSISSVDEMRTVWETNVFGVVVVTQAFLPLLRKATAARIVNVSSGLASLALARDPENPYSPHY
jgi:NAD(P)-dependent dehydrogenase (short-subunit alcohol dehydrogenase family)